MISNSQNFAEAMMLVRKPVSVVFQAFIIPEITKNFWFTKGSEDLKEGSLVTWEWEMYGFSMPVYVRQIIRDQKIVIEWQEPITTVEFNFNEIAPERTYVTIKHSGFKQSGEELLAAIKNSVGGFTTVLDGMKAYLEHGINLQLILDKYPKEVVQHGHS
jgi:uncharacterized protein YndB with AHSA1/START domain